MADLLKSVDIWFLVLMVVLLGGYFLWSIRTIFSDFTGAVHELKGLIGKLFDQHNDHESRLSALEGRCDAMHGETRTGGRRHYDPQPRFGDAK